MRHIVKHLDENLALKANKVQLDEILIKQKHAATKEMLENQLKHVTLELHDQDEKMTLFKEQLANFHRNVSVEISNVVRT